jgi:hypothetical protein
MLLLPLPTLPTTMVSVPGAAVKFTSASDASLLPASQVKSPPSTCSSSESTHGQRMVNHSSTEDMAKTAKEDA